MCPPTGTATVVSHLRVKGDNLLNIKASDKFATRVIRDDQGIHIYIYNGPGKRIVDYSDKDLQNYSRATTGWIEE